MARSRKVSRKKRSVKRKTSRKVAKRCPPGCVKKPMLLTDNGKIILGSTRAAKPKRKASRKVSRKRRSVKRKVSRKRRSVKRKVSRKRRSVKRKVSRKVSRKRRSAKRKASRKRKSAKRKASRKRKSAKRKASRKRKSAKRKASRKKTRNSPPSGVIKQQNLSVGSVMVGQDGKTMYKVVEITMRGKPVKKWAKMKFKMGQLFCSGKDDAPECNFLVSNEEQQRIAKEIRGQRSQIVRLLTSIETNRKTIDRLRKKETLTGGDKAEIERLIKLIIDLHKTIREVKQKEEVAAAAAVGALNQTRMNRLKEATDRFNLRYEKMLKRVAEQKARVAEREAKRKARVATR